MKKTAALFALIVFSMAMFLPFAFNNQAVNAQTTYTIQQIDQDVQVLHSGQVVVTDKIQLSGTVPSSFQIGFPYIYGSYLLKAVAYDSNNNVLSVVSGVQLQDQTDFYGFSVSLPEGSSSTFTVAFILSNAALTSTDTGFLLSFPAYPGLTQVAAQCNVNLALSSSVSVVSIEKPDGVVNGSSYATQNLAAFTYSSGVANVSAATGYIQPVVIPSLDRQINISPSGAVTATDTYKITNSASSSISYFLINLPTSATGVVARDQFGRVLSTDVYQSTSQMLVENVTFAVAVSSGETTVIALDYSLPSIPHSQFTSYATDLELFPYVNYYINAASVTVTPPEGAAITAPTLSQLGSSDSITRNLFQESLKVNRAGVSNIDSLVPPLGELAVTFDFNPLWIAFRPTSWMWAIAAVGIVVFAIWMRTRSSKAVAPAPKSAAKIETEVASVEKLTPEHIKAFVDSYEEKNKLNAEIRTLDARAKHGRIPRRRYRVQRRALEVRVETLNHTIANLKDLLSRAKGSYANIISQIEEAEIELNEIQLGIETSETRHETGELSLETYRTQLADLERRKEKAEKTLNGLLQRLR